MCSPICKTPPVETGKYTFHMTNTVDYLQCDVWDSIIGEEYFFAKTRHLAVVEKTSGNQVKPLYLMVNDGAKTVALIYMQELIFSFENALKNFKWEMPFWKSLLSWLVIRLLSFLKIPLLHTGNIFFTGDSGIYFRKGMDSETKETILTKVMEAAPWKTAFKSKTAATMIGNLYHQVRSGGIQQLGFHRMSTEPDLWMKIPDQWKSLADFISDLSSKYRVRANKVLADTAHLQIHPLEREDIIKHEALLLSLYKNVADKSEFNMAYMQGGCLAEMKDLYGDNFQVEVYLKGNQIIGFTSAFYVGTTAHAYYMGIDYAHVNKLPLYNRMLIEHVKTSIQRGCSLLHFGRTATEIKTTVGALPVPMHGYLKLENRFFNRFLPLLLGNFGNSHYTQRHPFREPVAEVVPSICSFEE